MQAQVDADNANITANLDVVDTLLSATLSAQTNVTAALSAASQLLKIGVNGLNQAVDFAGLSTSLTLQGFAVTNP